MMTTNTLITSDDPKGLHAIGLCRVAYNKAKLNEGKAQMLNEKGNEFQDGVLKLIMELTTPNQYADEVASSGYTYPKEYKLKPIEEQITKIAELFKLDGTQALEFAKNLPELPEGAEGWFAVPKVFAIVSKKSETTSESLALDYCEAVELVLSKIKSSRSFKNYREGEIVPSKLKQSVRTLSFLQQLYNQQQGDIIVIAGQLGMKHRGESVRRARETFAGNEFGMTSLMVCSIALTHPERLVRYDELDMDCAGDEFLSDGDGVFSKAPFFYFYNDRVEFVTHDVSDANDFYGSASAFLPQ